MEQEDGGMGDKRKLSVHSRGWCSNIFVRASVLDKSEPWCDSINRHLA